MPSSYTTSLRLVLPVEGDLDGTWGTVVNNGLTSLVDSAVAGSANITMTDANYTLTVVDEAPDEARQMFINLSGSLTTTRNVICPSVSKLYFVHNNTNQSIVFKTSAGSGVTVLTTTRAVLYCNGTDVVDAINALAAGTTVGGAAIVTPAATQTLTNKTINGSNNTITNVSLTAGVTGTLPIENGGTNATTASAARTSLGGTTLGANLFTITNPSAVTFPRFNADNTVSALNAADFRTAIGAGTGSGDVTTSGTQTLTNKTINGSNNTITNVSLTAGVTGTLPIENGGTNATTASAARTSLGGTTLGANLFTITNPSAVTFPRFNADNTVSALNAADFRTAIGAGTGTGDVTTTGTQTLTNKTISADNNTLSGIAASSFVLSNASGNIDGSAAQKAIPAGVVVGTTDTQTLTNKTVTNLVFDGDYTEEVFTITDGAGVDLDPSNGTVQVWTLGANRSPTANSFASGQSMTLMIDDGTASTVTWPSVTWKTDGGAPPVLNATGFTAIQLWKVSTVLYGARVGDA